MSRTALLLPYYPPWFRPTAPRYERLVSNHRSRCDVYQLLVPYGVVPERFSYASGSLMKHSFPVSDRKGRRAAAIRVRAWMDQNAPQYNRVVLVAFGDLMETWGRAAVGAKLDNVRLIEPNRRSRGIDGVLVRRKLESALQ
jgi:hypothetical protein